MFFYWYMCPALVRVLTSVKRYRTKWVYIYFERNYVYLTITFQVASAGFDWLKLFEEAVDFRLTPLLILYFT
jgi:hypothetical protein